MNCAEQHTFQVLTKRAERSKGTISEITMAKNIWMGVTVENQKASFEVKWKIE
jgi:protein gp37